MLGHPVVFAGLDPEHRVASEAEAFARLNAAARESGFEEVVFMAEPMAAVIGEPSHHRVEIAVDFGGGTFDVAVLDSRGEKPRIAAMAGVAVGGEVLDGVLFETTIGPALGLDALPNWLFNDMRTASSVRLLMVDPGVPSVLARIGGDAARIAGALLYEGHAYDFYRAIEAAKIELSGADSTRLQYAPLRLDVPLRRSAFEAMIKPELDMVDQAISRALGEAGIQPSDVERVLLTGGSGYIPAFRRRLAESFGDRKLVQRDAFTAVVHGLGVQAQRLWGGA